MKQEISNSRTIDSQTLIPIGECLKGRTLPIKLCFIHEEYFLVKLFVLLETFLFSANVSIEGKILTETTKNF